MTAIAVIAMGEMGSAVAGRLVERGAKVLTSLAGRSATSGERARAVGVTATDDAGIVEAADIILSIVPPANAAETAERFRPMLERAARRPAFIDCNAIAPATLHAIAGPFLQASLPFGDGSIIGSPPKSSGPGPRLYLSGPIEREAAILKQFGLDARLLSADLGDASALKMSYAGFTKGFQALGTAMVLGAARNGASASLLAELKDSQAALHAWLTRQLPTMYAKAYRWDGEMLEIAKFLEPEQGARDMLAGAAELYRHVASDQRIGPRSEIISILDQFVRGEPSN